MAEVPLRVLVAEDEPYNRKRLVRLLEEAGCAVVAELEDGPSVLEWLEAGGHADAAFLDIAMPGASGLDVALELPRTLPVVFVTAYSEHAVRAFEAAAVDYLLKPATAQRLALTLERLQERQTPRTASSRKGPLRFPIRAGDGLVLVDLVKATHFELDEGTVWAHVGNERLKTPWKSLGEAEAFFPSETLLRIHRHLLLRPEAVVGLKPGTFGRLEVRITGGTTLEVSRGTAPALKARLGLS